jgi:hypothetical protein
MVFEWAFLMFLSAWRDYQERWIFFASTIKVNQRFILCSVQNQSLENAFLKKLLCTNSRVLPCCLLFLLIYCQKKANMEKKLSNDWASCNLITSNSEFVVLKTQAAIERKICEIRALFRLGSNKTFCLHQPINLKVWSV